MPDSARLLHADLSLKSDPPLAEGMNCLRTPTLWQGAQSLPVINGKIPDDLDGRLYRVGPGRFEKDGQTFAHWFDGEGLVLSIDFKNGQAEARAAFVDDPYPHDPPPAIDDRGRFGIAPASLWKRLQSIWTADSYINPANTALLYWGNRLFGLFEGGLPTELDPHDLSTRGKTDLGAVRRAFCAHPKYHARTDSWFNQGFRTAPRPMMDYTRMKPDGTAERFASVAYDGALFTHDFAVTDTHIISVCSPMFADAAAVIFGAKPLSEVLSWYPERGTEFIVVPIDNPRAVQRIKGPPLFYSHTANAYDRDGCLVIQGIAAPDCSNMHWVNAVKRGARDLPRGSVGVLIEIILNPATGEIKVETVLDRCVEFPQINPRCAGTIHNHVYLNGFRDEAVAYEDFFDTVIKRSRDGTVISHVVEGGHYVSEPIFAPCSLNSADADEDDGYLLTVNYNASADRSYLDILTAKDLAPVAQCAFDRALPMSFHGLWIDRQRLPVAS
ncbi:MAG: carotenoid oxygenase family protein [Pseudomonadota bacterium]